MKSTIGCMAAGVGVVVLAGVLQAANGIVITQKVTSGGTATTHQVQMDQNHMRVEMAGAKGEQQVMIFDGTKQVMYIVDPEKKTYSELTKDDADRLGAQLNDAMAQLKAQMANMPPAQRAQMEAMMKGRGAALPAATKPEFKKAGTATVGKWTCDRYEGYTNGEKTSEVCTVDPKALGLGLDDFAVTREMQEFFARIMPQIAGRMFAIGSVEKQGYPGVPIRQASNLMGREIISEISDVTRGPIAESAFAVPAGYEKQPFMGAAGRGRQ